MSTNDPYDRFKLPPLLPVDQDEVIEGPSGDALVDDALVEPIAEPEDVALDDALDEVEPSETEATPFSGIASALEVVEQLDTASAEEPDEAPATPSYFDASTAEADDRVFAVATTDLGLEPPDYLAPPDTSDEASAPLDASGAELPDLEVSDEMWPHFLMAEAEPETTGEHPAFVAAIAEMPAAAEEKKHAKPTVARTLAEIPILLVVAAVIAFLVKSFLAQAYYIPSGSMLPQLKVDDRVVVSKLAYKTHDPRRGDIIVFDDPRTGSSTTESTERTGVSKWVRKVGEGVGVIQPSTDEFIKRVIGLPGDTVEGHDGSVFINGKKLVEPYLPEGVETSDFAPQTVENGRLWVMGDNRSGSADSRVFGQIKISTIVGRALVKVWPFSHISFL